MATIENLILVEYFLRKLKRLLDLSFVYEEAAGLHSRKYGPLLILYICVTDCPLESFFMNESPLYETLWTFFVFSV